MDKIDLQPMAGFETHDFDEMEAMRLALSKGYWARVFESWMTEPSTLDDIDARLWSLGVDHSSCLIDDDKALALVTYNTKNRKVAVYTYAARPAQARAMMALLKQTFPVLGESEDTGSVPVGFWTNTSRGPRQVYRDIDVPTWDTIRENYSTVVQKELDFLHNGFKPSHGGQLLLWHGEPGTGKTYAIRSVAQAWRKWCTFQYIVDPDVFFSDSHYMMSVLVDDEDDGPEGGDKNWRLFILEDTGELLTRDAKINVGQGLSRLLNVVDGMIGQGLRVLLLITTNEELGTMHPAVIRPGRAAVNFKFDKLNPEESAIWAAKHGVTVERGSHSIASLYALMEGFHGRQNGSGPSIGFAPRHASAATALGA